MRVRLRGSGPLLLLLAVAAAYIGVVEAGFVWDDTPLVVQNRLTGDLGNIPRFFTMDLWDGSPVEASVSGYYRPLVLVSFAIDRALYGLSAAGHHLHGLLWHLAAVALLYRLLRPIIGPGGALLAATIFGLHPVQSEAVVWVAARNDPMAAALGLGALLCLEPGAGGGERRLARLFGAFVLTALAGFTKENVVLLPLLHGALELARGRGFAEGGGWGAYAPMFTGIGLTLSARVLAGVGGATLPDADGLWFTLLRWPNVLGIYGSALVAPWPLSVGYTLEYIGRLPTWRLLLGNVGLLGWLLLCRRSGAAGRAGLLWALVSFAPTLLPIADKGLVGERYLYLPLAGIGLTVGAWARERGPTLALAGALPALFILHLRVPDWANDIELWSATVRTTPSPFNWGSLGHALRSAGEPGAALAAFERALADRQPDLTVCPRVVGAALDTGDLDRAMRRVAWTQERGCDDPVWRGQAASALAYGGRWAEAEALLEGAPPDPEHRGEVVRAALALDRGDEPALRALEAGWTRDRPLRPLAEALLVKSRAPPSARRDAP